MNINERTDGYENYRILDRDDDVLLFDNRNTFTVGIYRTSAYNKFCAEFLQPPRNNNSSTTDIKSTFGVILFDSIGLSCSEMEWKSTAVNCKFLQIGDKEWKEGKLRVKVKIINSYRHEKKKYDAVLDLCIEFCADRSSEPSPQLEILSPLDEIRRSEEYKKIEQ